MLIARAHARWLTRSTAVVAGLSSGVGFGLLLALGDIVAAGFALAGVGLFAAIIAFLVSAPDRSALSAIVALAFGGRLLLLSALHYVLIAIGRGGHLFGDDATYADLSARLAQYLHGFPVVVGWFGERYLFGNFVYLETGVFYIFGPQVTIVKILNAFAGVLLALVMFALSRHLFGRAPALAALGLTAFFPSLTLWSVLNLKESLSVLLAGVTLWLVARYAAGRSTWRVLPLAYLSLALVEGFRNWLFLLLVGLVPIALAIVPGRSVAHRLRVTIGAFAASALLVLGFAQDLGLERLRPEMLEQVRSNAAVGARTGYGEAGSSLESPIEASSGDRFVVISAFSTEPPPATGRVFEVPFGSLLTLAPAPGRPVPDAPPETVFVRLGDIVVVRGERAQTDNRTLTMRAGESVRLVPRASAPDRLAALTRLLLRLPTGLSYAIGAPFPWAAASVPDRIAVPEMLVWYAIVLAAAVGAWELRRRWREAFPVLAYVAGVLLTLAVVEGNVGTLFRHRSMVLPLVFVLASAPLARLAALVALLRRQSDVT